MGHETWVSTDSVYKVELRSEFIAKAIECARSHLPYEVGAPLIGSYHGGDRAIVEDTAPVATDSWGGEVSIPTGVAGYDALFEGLYVRSRGRIHYVGEWHSHPAEGETEPSSTDDENMFAIAQDPDARCPEVVLVLFALGETVQHRVYVYSSSGRRVDLVKTVPVG